MGLDSPSLGDTRRALLGCGTVKRSSEEWDTTGDVRRVEPPSIQGLEGLAVGRNAILQRLRCLLRSLSSALRRRPA